jgi:hypothetical protein
VVTANRLIVILVALVRGPRRRARLRRALAFAGGDGRLPRAWRAWRLAPLPLAACVLAIHPGAARASEPVIEATPALQPAFAPGTPDYVTRCEPSGSVLVSVDAMGAGVSVDSAPAQTGSFNASVKLSEGQAFTIKVGSGAEAHSYDVRCLPAEFPSYTAQVLGPTQAGYYLTTPAPSEHTGYVTLFNSEGVPVWWYHPREGVPIDADLDPNGDLSWALETGGESFFGLPGRVHVEQRDLDGDLLNTLETTGTPTDFHEAWPLANGNFLIDSYVPQTHVLVPFVGERDVLDASFQEVEPDGHAAYVWNSSGHLDPLDSLRYWYMFFPYPGLSEDVWDWQHINAVMPYKSGYLVSLRNNGAVYYIDAATGEVVWKLGGTSTSRSLKIVGDPDGTSEFGSQHDVRVWPDGTISVFDNGTRNLLPPRVLRFSIDEATDTATLIQSFSNPSIHFSICCGSARLLPAGNWVVSWGSTRYIEELEPGGTPTFRLSIGGGSYRAVPVLPGQLSAASLEGAMDEMHPRAPEG